MNKARRNLVKNLSVLVSTALITPGQLLEKAGKLFVPSVQAQTLPESFVGEALKADYINQLTPSPIDGLITEATASHLFIPNPWHILATKNDENTYKIEILDPGSKGLRMGILNIDGSWGTVEQVEDKTCAKLKGGKMTKALIYEVSANNMIFQARLFRGAALLQWKLTPGVGSILQTDCA